MVKIDHISFRFFLNQKDLNNTEQKWVSKLQAYDFDIEYVKGKNNVLADGLYRKPYLCNIIEITADWKALIIAKYAKNNFTNEILQSRI